MPTIAQYKQHYPNLTPAQVKLLHSARIATRYSSWSLSHTRTIALAPLIYDLPPSPDQLEIANKLLASDTTKNYKEDILNYPRLNSDNRLLSAAQPPEVPHPGVRLTGSDWAVCKQVGYHSDDVDCDQHAYAFWCVKSTDPMTLMIGGNAYPMREGQLVIFDARVPHALLASSETATMVGMISTVELTPELQTSLGISWRRAGSLALDKLRVMDNLNIDLKTGDFSGPSL